MINSGIYLHLDPAFQPFGATRKHEVVSFPSDCEMHIKIHDDFAEGISVTITHRIRSSDDILLVLLATDALRRKGVGSIELFIPFLPYARQDRVMVPGEPLSAKVFANLINSQNYAAVHVYDAHSDVGPALINKCVNYSNHDFVQSILSRVPHNYLLVCPDMGASKKMHNLCKAVGYESPVIQGHKVRDLNTGRITRYELWNAQPEEIKDAECYIVDDICDGGATFIMLAGELKMRGAAKVNLIVSHGIFSQGLPLARVDRVFTTNSFDQPTNTDYIIVKNLANGLLSL